METIVYIKRVGAYVRGFVSKVFRDDESAARWTNRQTRPVQVVRLPGEWKVGDMVPLDVRGEPFETRYLTTDSI